MAWWKRAACRGADPDLFHAEHGNSARDLEKAKAYCRRCPVTQECLADADEHGIRAGLTARERAYRAAKPKQCVACGRVREPTKFHLHANAADGLRPECKTCTKVGVVRRRSAAAREAS